MKIPMKKLILTLAIAFIGSSTFASPDHDHGAPSFQPRKGGVLKSAHENHFEMVRKGTTIFLYAYDEKGNSVPTSNFKLSTELEIPKRGKSAITLTDKKTHWESTIDWKGAHRVTLAIGVTVGKEKDDVKFTLENK